MGNALGAVSFDTEDLILVDSDDQIVGTAPKKAVHQPGGQLHRAFSIFIFAGGNRVLLHRRSASNLARLLDQQLLATAKQESYEAASHRQLQEELSMQTTLNWLCQFEYQAHFMMSVPNTSCVPSSWVTLTNL